MRAMAGRSRALAAILLAVAVAATFGGAVLNGFSDVDDPRYVTDNVHVREGLTPGGIAWAFRSTEAANWHPLTWISHEVDTSLFGTGPAGPHAVNVLLHAAVIALLFLVLARATSRPGLALTAAALVGLHPLRVESVAWIAERKDVLSMALAGATLLAYDRFVRDPRGRRLALVVVLYAASLLAKPMLVTLPLVLLLLDAWPYRRLLSPHDVARRLREKIALFVLAAGSAAVTVVAQSAGSAVESWDALSLGTRTANAIVSVVVYLRQIAWPTGLAFFYPHPGLVAPYQLSAPRVISALLLLVAISSAAWLLRRRAPYLLVGWSWFLVTLVPVIGLVQVGEQGHADRYTYLPSIGLTIAVVWGVDALVERVRLRTAAATAAVVVAAALASASFRQTRVWRDPRDVHRQALAHAERNYVAHNNLGVLLARDGRLDEAGAHFEAALAIVPGEPRAEDNLGTLLMRRGRVTEAIPHFTSALARSPDPEIKNNLGNALIADGRPDEGIAMLREAIEARPDYALAHYNLAMALARRGRSEDALGEFDLTIRFDPGHAAAWAQRGLLRATLGRKAEAVADFRQALAIEPNWVEVREALEKTSQ